MKFAGDHGSTWRRRPYVIGAREGMPWARASSFNVGGLILAITASLLLWLLILKALV